MHVTFVIARYRPALGGTERQAELLAGWLGRRGIGVTVFTHAHPPAPAIERGEAVEVHRISPPAGGRISSLLFCGRLARRLRRAGRGTDAVQAFLASAPALVVRGAARRLGVPALLTFGGSGPSGDAGTASATALGRWKLRRLATGFERYLCPSAAVREEFLARGFPAGRVELLPNGVDDRFFTPLGPGARDRLRDALGWSGRTVALFVGRFDPAKNLGRLLECWERVSHRHPEALLALAGDGPLRGDLERLAGSLAPGAAAVLPPTDAEGVRQLLRAADLFVLPSHAEGLSCALLEAMACGLAPAASDIPGNRELVGPLGAGLLFPPRDADAMAAALEGLVSDPAERARAGAAARESARSAYGIDAVGRRYLGVLASCGALGAAPPR